MIIHTHVFLCKRKKRPPHLAQCFAIAAAGKGFTDASKYATDGNQPITG